MPRETGKGSRESLAGRVPARVHHLAPGVPFYLFLKIHCC